MDDIGGDELKRIVVVLLGFAVLAAVAIAAILISNILHYEGPLEQQTLEISDTAGKTEPIALLNGTTTTFNFTVANRVEENIIYRLNFTFNSSMTVDSIAADLVRIYLDNGTYVNSSEALNWSGAYVAESGNHSLAPFEATWFELRLTVTFQGSGSYTLDIEARA